MRRLEIAAAWVAVAFAWCATVLGLVGPLLGGSGPGIQGPVGFVVEIVAAMLVPGGVLTAIVAVAAMLRRLWWPAGMLAVVALVILVPELCAWSQARVVHAPGDTPALRVAAVNLCAENLEDPRMEECLRQLDADVLVLPELTASWAEQLEKWFAGDYPQRWVAAVPERPGYQSDGLNVAVWSRLPAAGEHQVHYLRGSPAIRVLLRWHGRAFALYGVHPWKPYPYQLFGSAWRDRQGLLDWIRNERLPTVVAGDFNATPRSAFMGRLRLFGLTNASQAVCGAAPGTWPMQIPLLAPFRVAIDHVMVSEAFTAVAFRRGMTTNSDHAPVIAELRWRDE